MPKPESGHGEIVENYATLNKKKTTYNIEGEMGGVGNSCLAPEIVALTVLLESHPAFENL